MQMIAGEHPAGDEVEDAEAVLLGEEHAAAMADLALATKPGPWSRLTHRYGPFYGIFREGRLAAMAGERMLPAPSLAKSVPCAPGPNFAGPGWVVA